MEANLDSQRRLTWKKIMENGSLESYSPHFTEVMLWANISGVGAGALIPYKRGDDDVGWFISYSHS